LAGRAHDCRLGRRLVDRASRDDRGAQPGGDERLHGRTGIRLEHELRLQTPRPKTHLDLRARRRVRDQREANDRRGPDTFRAPRESRGRLHEHDERVVVERHAVERRVAKRKLGEGEVDVAARDESDDTLGGLRRLESDRHLRAHARERGEDAGNDARRDVLRRTHPQRRRPAAVKGGEVGLRVSHSRDDCVRVREQDDAGGGQRDGSRAARAVDEAPPGDPLERGDLVTDRGLDVSEALGGAAERPLARDGVERGEVPELDAEPVLARHERSDARARSQIGPTPMLNSLLTGYLRPDEPDRPRDAAPP